MVELNNWSTDIETGYPFSPCEHIWSDWVPIIYSHFDNTTSIAASILRNNASIVWKRVCVKCLSTQEKTTEEKVGDGN